ncbi:MAG: hypothetical protein ACLSHC_11805 [Bilophila wadsworthia]
MSAGSGVLERAPVCRHICVILPWNLVRLSGLLPGLDCRPRLRRRNAGDHRRPRKQTLTLPIALWRRPDGGLCR